MTIIILTPSDSNRYPHQFSEGKNYVIKKTFSEPLSCLSHLYEMSLDSSQTRVLMLFINLTREEVYYQITFSYNHPLKSVK